MWAERVDGLRVDCAGTKKKVLIEEWSVSDEISGAGMPATSKYLLTFIYHQE
jgi:hypothetical protein